MLAMVPAVGASSSPQYTLFRSQDIREGNVQVSRCGDTLSVTINTFGHWYLAESHIHVGKELSDFPRVGRWGNPVPGRFDYKNKFDQGEDKTYTETIDISALNIGDSDDLLIAVHVVVEKNFGDECYPNWVDDTAWAGNCYLALDDYPSNRFTERGNWGTYIKYPAEW